jgi:hypothetical protein
MSRLSHSLTWLGILAAMGCQDEPAPAPAAAGGQRSDVAELAARQAREAAARALNPEGLPVYSGPVGNVRGVVTVSGDDPPIVPEVARELDQLPPGSCLRANEIVRKLYRQGLGRTLADVLVTVTEYQGFLPARGESVRVEAKGCAFDSRVLAVTFGQRLDVFNLDAQPYMPRLMGGSSYALRVALPGGAPVPVFVPRPGRYALVDQTRDYMRSDLFALSYPTFDVTGLDGKFEILHIPVGKVKVSAYSPALGKVVEQSVEVQAGVDRQLAFEIAFSEAEYRQGSASSPSGKAPDRADPAAPPDPPGAGPAPSGTVRR